MSRRVDHADRHRPDVDLVTVLHRVVRVVDPRIAVDAGRDAVFDRQAPMPRHVVRVRVRFDRADDAQSALFGLGNDGLDREGRIDDDGYPGVLIPDQVARAAQVVVQELVEDHACDRSTLSRYLT